MGRRRGDSDDAAARRRRRCPKCQRQAPRGWCPSCDVAKHCVCGDWAWARCVCCGKWRCRLCAGVMAPWTFVCPTLIEFEAERD